MTRGDDPALLTFQWKDRDRSLIRLVGFSLVSFASATVFFMLFKVVYPQARHYSTAPQQVLMLNPAQAATRDILNRTRDENFLLLGSEVQAQPPVRDDGGLFPVFRPGFSGFEMKLMDLPGEPDRKSLPRVYSIKDMPLPPPATVMKARPPAAGPPHARPPMLRVMLRGDLSGRELLSEGAIKGGGLTDVSSLRFRLCVNHFGMVTFALPLDSIADAKQTRLLRKAVSSLRFKPVNSPDIQWGDASFSWEGGNP